MLINPVRAINESFYCCNQSSQTATQHRKHTCSSGLALPLAGSKNVSGLPGTQTVTPYNVMSHLSFHPSLYEMIPVSTNRLPDTCVRRQEAAPDLTQGLSELWTSEDQLPWLSGQ